MNILFTGASGFFGKNLQLGFKPMSIISIGKSKCNNIVFDLSKGIPQLPICDLVIHAGGKAHKVPKNEDDIQDFYSSNVQATINLIKGLEILSKKPIAFVFISSVAVYGKTKGELISEDEALLAKDPYGQSKIKAEKIISDWCHINGVSCTILRLPLLLGKNPKGNLADMINGIQKGFYFNIGTGSAKKSMLMVSDVSTFISNYYMVGGIYNLTDGYHPSFNELSNLISQLVGKNSVPNMPFFLANCLAVVGDIIGSKFPINSKKLEKITSDLTFDDSKARSLGWTSTPVLEAFTI